MVLDPYETSERIILAVSHDAGMRLRQCLARDLLKVPSEDETSDLLGGPNIEINGEPAYALFIYGFTIQWPARRIDLEPGRVQYL